MDVKEFSAFVKENISKILDAPHPKYPLNRDNIREWINRHSDARTRAIARAISNLFENISWEEFLKKMNNVANDLGLYTNLYLYLPAKTDVGKSNYFTTILFFHIFCHEQEQSFKGMYHIGDIIPEDSIIVVADDASYSGAQMYDLITDIIDVRVFLAVPYVSETARIMLSTLNVIVPPSSETFHTLMTYLGDRTEQDINEMCRYISGKHGLYFDFKLPDTVSVLTEILAYGFTLDQMLLSRKCGGIRKLQSDEKSLCLIEGCEAAYNTYDNLGLCPTPFYKSIKYVFK